MPGIAEHSAAYPPIDKVVSKPDSHVILIAIDGLRPDALTAERTPTLKRLISQGAFTDHARNILPPRTLPNHAAMITGLDAAGHGLTENTFQGSRRLEVPTIFDRAREAGLSSAMYYGKDKFLIFQRQGSLNWAERRDGADVAADFARDFAKVHWNLAMLCFPDCDIAGHADGWMSPRYLEAVRRVDGYLALVMASVENSGVADKVHILLTADHGGEGKNHFKDLPVNRTIPFLVLGPSVKAGSTLGTAGRPVQITDMAPTAAHLLGLDMGPAAKGRYLGEAFETRTAVAPAIRPMPAEPGAMPAAMAR